MRRAKVFLPCIIAMALATAASAEIYQSKDAQGNTVYSDMPSQGAEEIKVPRTNAADPVVAPPSPPPQEQATTTQKTSAKPAKPERQEMGDDTYHYVDDDYDDLSDRRALERRRGNDDVAQPKRERPVSAEPRRNVSRPAARVGARR